jgi:hypothetical protein
MIQFSYLLTCLSHLIMVTGTQQIGPLSLHVCVLSFSLIHSPQRSQCAHLNEKIIFPFSKPARFFSVPGLKPKFYITAHSSLHHLALAYISNHISYHPSCHSPNFHLLRSAYFPVTYQGTSFCSPPTGLCIVLARNVLDQHPLWLSDTFFIIPQILSVLHGTEICKHISRSSLTY